MGEKRKAADATEAPGKYFQEDPKKRHARSLTANRYFNSEEKVRQGPHTLSHVFTAHAFEDRMRLDDYRRLLDTRLIPSPGKANAILKEGLERTGRLDTTVKWRRTYLLHYTKLYNKLLGEDDPSKQRLLAEKLVELSPQQTYRWAEGYYTPAQIAGKGERRAQALLDYDRFKTLKDTKYRELRKNGAVSMLERWSREGFNSVDAASLPPNEVRRTVMRATQYPRAADGDTLSVVSQESDLDMLEKDTDTDTFGRRRYRVKAGAAKPRSHF